MPLSNPPLYRIGFRELLVLCVTKAEGMCVRTVVHRKGAVYYHCNIQWVYQCLPLSR